MRKTLVEVRASMVLPHVVLTLHLRERQLKGSLSPFTLFLGSGNTLFLSISPSLLSLRNTGFWVGGWCICANF